MLTSDRIRIFALLACASWGMVGFQRPCPAQATAELDQQVVQQAQATDFFEQRIRPVLVESCLDCHAADSEASGGLLLDSKDGWMAGGDSGAAIVPGDAAKSLVWRAISYQDPSLQMPPDGILSEQVRADFQQWINGGAVDPRRGLAPTSESHALTVERAEEHWAYRDLPPKSELKLPAVDGPRTTTIDGFIHAELEAAGLTAGKAAGKAALLRRLCFDLTGLPPSREQLAAFLQDDAPEAYTRLVDSLLASPHFGERLARRWMDVTRYADSITLRGFVLPEAWRYRDYLVSAYNEDRPFDEMIREQIAGDLLKSNDHARRQLQLQATGFLVLGNTNLEQQDKAQLEMDVIDEQLEVIGRAFLGQTIGCARCHDHKFDPIPTADYYALAGILRSAKSLEHENVSKWIEQPLPLPDDQERRYGEIERQSSELAEQIKELKRQISELEKEHPKRYRVDELPGLVVDSTQAKLVGQWTESVHVKPFVGQGYLHAPANSAAGELRTSEASVRTATFEAEGLEPGEYEVRFAYTHSSNRASNVKVQVFSADGETVRTLNQRRAPEEDAVWVSLGKFRFEEDGQAYVLVSNQGADGVVIVDAVQFLSATSATPVATRDEAADSAQLALQQALKPLEQNQQRLEAELSRRPRYLTLIEAEPPRDLPIHIRGDVHNLGNVVPRGFLTAVGPRAEIAESSSGRLELANWLASADNPLTARVYANRVWMWMMGRGIVASPNNLGTTGVPPTHPRLLDWLARELIQSDWSTKRLVRLIVHTDAYRRAVIAPNKEQLRIDPDNRLLWRGNMRRLSVEALRDAMLMVSGELDLELGGSLIRAGTKADYGYRHASARRSLYHPVFRNALPELYEAFDFADTSVSIAQRPRSTVATQALVLMNHPWVLDRAKASSGQLSEQFSLHSKWTSEQLQAAVSDFTLRCFAREPTEGELQLALRFLLPAVEVDVRQQRLTQWVHAMLASLDFRYLD